MSTRSVLPLLLASILGCGAAATGPGPASVTDIDDAELLVWVHGGDAGPSTYTIHSSGRVSEPRAGIEVALPDGATREIVIGSHTLPMYACDETLAAADEGRDPEPNGEAALPTLVVRGAEGEATLWTAEATIAEELDAHIDVVASLGPYLFVRRGVFEYTCGAHGHYQSDMRVIDLRTNDAVPVLDELGANETLRTAALAAFEGNDRLDGEVPEAGQLEHVAVYPAIDENGVTLLHQFTQPVCYACSDAEWTSYTASVRVPGASFGERLAPYTDIPVPLQRFIETHPDLDIGGFSSRRAQ